MRLHDMFHRQGSTGDHLGRTENQGHREHAQEPQLRIGVGCESNGIGDGCVQLWVITYCHDNASIHLLPSTTLPARSAGGLLDSHGWARCMTCSSGCTVVWVGESGKRPVVQVRCGSAYSRSYIS